MKKKIFILFIFPFFLSGQYLDSLKFALKTAKHDSIRCNVLNELIEGEDDDVLRADYNEQLKKLAEEHISNATTTALRNFYLMHLADALKSKGLLASLHGDIPKALELLHKSLKIQEEIADKKRIAQSLNNIALIYDNQGDIPKALEFYHKSLKIREEIKDKNGIAQSFNNIGAIYQNQGDIPKALEYFQKCLKILEEIMNKKGIAYSLNNIGFIYDDMGNIPKALEYYNKSLKIQEEIMDKYGVSTSLNNIGIIYKNQGDIPKALEFYYKSLNICEEMRDQSGIATSLINIGSALIDQKKPALAIAYADRSMSIAKELGFPENILNAAALLKNIYKSQNKFKEAFNMYELEIQMQDSINNQETRKESVKKQMQYQYETQALEIKNGQDKKDIIAKAALKQREKERNYFVIGFILVIMLALFIFRSYRQKQKANVIISRQKHEVEESKKEIIDSIRYAKRIQKAHLPTEKHIEKNLNRLQNKG